MSEERQILFSVVIYDQAPHGDNGSFYLFPEHPRLGDGYRADGKTYRITEVYQIESQDPEVIEYRVVAKPGAVAAS